MPLKILSKRIRLAVVLTGIALSLILIFYFIPKNLSQGGSIKSLVQSSLIQSQIQGDSSQSPIQSSSTLPAENVIILPKPEQTNSGLPVRLKIPGINVDAALEYVGLTSQGAMDIPKDFAHVAWFNLGPRPGEEGSAVMAGHYGRKNGAGSVFDNLYKLRPGDKLYIENDQGVIISFVVRATRRYDPQADASDVFGSSDGKSHLNLVTCEGTWNKVSKSYSRRLVVFTDKE